ncbi:MAG: hypothetical protein KF830_07080 [Planctomycetes bacterium]|nr:hypothetical protein [Planctomycetota bacterium]
MSQPAPSPRPRPRLSRRRRLLFALVPIAVLLLGAELVIRLVRAPLHFGSFRELRLDLMRRNYPAEPHPLLGYAPRPNYRSRDNHWGTLVTIDGDGLRRNGDRPPPDGPCVATVGDSFTFGDQVDDDASWPAQLERVLDRPVKNGGVFGYSLTQAVLRAEWMLERFPVTALVVSFIADDLTRCEYRKRYTPVPWFDLVGDGLELHPVQAPEREPPDPARWWKDLFGHSALVDAVLANTCRAFWFEDEKQVTVPHLRGRGHEIGKELVERLDEVCRARGVRLLLVLQGEAADARAASVLRHAEALGVQTLDLVARYLAARAADPTLEQRWFDGHMTPAGNRWVAEQVAAALREVR